MAISGSIRPVPAFDSTTGTQVSRETQHRHPSNISLSISEAFLNRLIARVDVKPGEVRDNILGADVTGRQTTTSRLKLDLVPSTNQGRGVFVLTGEVHSMTTGVTPQAMVETAGRQEFVATKDLLFDGRVFSTRHAQVFVRAQNQTLGAMTQLTGTLLGGIADRIAYRTAERMRPESEAIARSRVAERVYPEFDGEVDKQLTSANQMLEQKVRTRLSAANLLPRTQSVFSTNDWLTFSALIADSKGSDSAASNRVPSATNCGMQIALHESLFNELCRRAGLNGHKTTDKELQAQLDTVVGLLGGAVSPRESAPVTKGLGLPKLEIVTEIELDSENPISVRLDEDRLVISINAQFKPAGQNLLPPMTVEVSYRTTLDGESIRCIPDAPRVMAQDRVSQERPATIAEQAVQSAIAASLPTFEFRRGLPNQYWPLSGTPPRISAIKSQEGWCTIAVD